VLRRSAVHTTERDDDRHHAVDTLERASESGSCLGMPGPGAPRGLVGAAERAGLGPFLSRGATAEFVPPETLAVRIPAEVRKWGEVAKGSGVTLD